MSKITILIVLAFFLRPKRAIAEDFEYSESKLSACLSLMESTIRKNADGDIRLALQTRSDGFTNLLVRYEKDHKHFVDTIHLQAKNCTWMIFGHAEIVDKAQLKEYQKSHPTPCPPHNKYLEAALMIGNIVFRSKSLDLQSMKIGSDYKIRSAYMTAKSKTSDQEHIIWVYVKESNDNECTGTQQIFELVPVDAYSVECDDRDSLSPCILVPTQSPLPQRRT